ncbi:hypothetical protein AVEN_177533-1 [Araneus ventricosus]|uniref:Uncharacterized protein n=1 Tax=Araneus ventricosus TaxID=182803 RepID=A0A4Y1ZV35_ARAVE|nr:hypothetical protein AVEN_177533-1 [Araneus ventricosus]
MRTAVTSARAKYMQYLESERSKEKTETKQLKRKALEEEIEFLKQKKMFLQTDIHQTNEKANDLAKEAEKSKNINLFIQSHELRKTVSEKEIKINTLDKARKIVHDRTPKTNYSYTAALTTIKNPDTPLEPIQTPTDPKPSTSATKNEETITVKLSDWLALLKAHKLSLEKEKTTDKKHEFLKPAPKNKRPKKDHANSKETNSNVKMKSNPNKTKSQDKESESDLQTLDTSISEMELSEEVNLASFKSPKIIDSNFKSKLKKKTPK